MTSQTSTLSQTPSQTADQPFQSGNAVTLSAGHFLHDTFSAFLSPLLPELIEKLSLSLTQAGTLTALVQLPSILNPLIGYLDDKINLRWMVIFAPAITATLMSAMGTAPTYMMLAILLAVAGLSVASFHATAPAVVARVSGSKVGKGMSFFMAGGELGRTLGPLVAVWGVSMFALEGLYRLAAIGWITSLIIFLRFRNITPHVARQTGFRGLFPAARGLFLPIAIIVAGRSLLISSLGFYLPTLLKSEGATLLAAGSALAIYQLAGVAGALAGGTLSDRIGRKPVLFITSLIAPLLVFAFLALPGGWLIPLLIILGFLSLSTQPVLLALVQDHLPEHRSVANGVYMAYSFIMQSTSAFLIGALGDQLGLRSTFFWMALLSLTAALGVLLLPKQTMKAAQD
ncbi:MAG: MFS transporter [Anaerolineales bacterium]|nr:MFS transporter [Anaerolineales bacterium]